MNIRNYRITAKYNIQHKEMVFQKDIRALDKKRALEKFYSILGSQKIKRSQIRIIEIKEIQPDEIKSRKLQKIALSDNPALYVE